MAMHLLCQSVPNSSPLACESYFHLKRCLLVIEAQGFLSLRVLQAQLLLGLYEISHAIYPAAYLTIGHCAQVGHALGLNDMRSNLKLVQLSSR
jgi:hypothetical protein